MSRRARPARAPAAATTAALALALAGPAATRAQDLAAAANADAVRPAEAPCPSGGARVVETFANGAAWDFCWSTRERDGLVIQGARWRAPGAAAPYPVLADGRLAQLHVAYDDGDVAYNDVTQYGLGGTWLQELDAADCPGGRLLAERGRRVACVFASDGRSSHRGRATADAGQRVTLFTVSQVGAYTYIVAWHFHADGTLEPVVGASGALQRAGADPTLPFGRTLANEPDTLWLSHTHAYHWRLDLDLGERADDDAFVASVHERDPDGRRRRVSRVQAEEAAFAPAPEALQAWHLMERPPAPGSDPIGGRGYALEASGGGHAFVPGTSGAEGASDLHVTVARDCERHASQNARFFPGCPDGIGAFVDGESLAGADLVLWKRISFHHVPRNEDRPRMHTHWDGLAMRPVNVAASTPGLGAPDGDVGPVAQLAADDPVGAGEPAGAVITGGGAGAPSPWSLAALVALAALARARARPQTLSSSVPPRASPAGRPRRRS